MSLTINTNVASLNANLQLNKAINDTKASFDKLSSGKRINKASDDSAGLAIAMDMLTNADTGSVAARNISDGASALAIADGAIQSASDITTRLSELSTQAANGTLSDSQRSALSNEFTALRSELDRIASTTEFNGQNLLNGGSAVTIQAGTDGSAASQITAQLPGVSSASLKLTSDLSTAESARAALDQAKAATQSLASSRSEIGASESRLASAFENLKTAELGQRAAASRILDTDVAAEVSKLATSQILQQTSLAVQAQANLQPANVLKLLS